MQGYKFTAEQSAINASKQCADYYGLPKSKDDVTQNWVDYQFAEFNNPTFWYIAYDESLLPVLGEPTEFDVNQPPFEDATN